MTKLLPLGAVVALFPLALQAATPPSRGVSESRGSGSSTGGRSTGQSAGSSGQSSRVSSGASLGGAPIPGLCMLSQSAVLSNAKVALAADARLKQLDQQMQAELQSEATSINNDAKALDGQRTSLAAADFQSRQATLQARANALQQKSQLRQRELATTRQKALNRISTEAQPVIAQAFRAHDCSLLIDRNTVLLGNMSGDITAEVARGLDAKISTITFERERLAQ